MRLANTLFRPPGDKWFYVVEPTGRYFESSVSIATLERHVVEHMEASGIEIPLDLRLRIEDYMCQRLPPGSCIGGHPSDPSLAPISYFAVMDAFEAVRPRLHPTAVDEREADRRALVCRTCRLNDQSLCGDCTGMQARISAMLGRRVSGMEFMGVCRDLRLPTLAVIFLDPPPPVVTPRAASCWRAPNHG